MDAHYCCCPDAGAVVALQLPGNNLTGDIGLLFNSSALGTSLQFVNLESNWLTGQIPFDLSQFSRVKGLHFSSNQLQGPMPEGIRDMTSLIILNLSQ